MSRELVENRIHELAAKVSMPVARLSESRTSISIDSVVARARRSYPEVLR